MPAQPLPHRAIRTCVDSSVFGGIHDDEFAEDSARFFAQAGAGRFALLTSALVADELQEAPARVQRHFESWLPRVELVAVSGAALALQRAYLDARILTARWADDAMHVALATVAGADLIVSWNFRHIVHFEKAPRYNAVNRLHGWREIAIHTPSEVVSYEDQDV